MVSGPCGVLDYKNVMPTMDRVVTCKSSCDKSSCEELGASAFGMARNGHSLNEMVEN